ncbi:MAG: hypothetical protein KA096_01370 [Bacteroidales bacterium]|nr:hypothetical protein [Bacteroidales bacterium]
MNAKEIKTLESLTQTENEHWNGFAFDLIEAVIKQGQFENPEPALQLVSSSIDLLTEHCKQPLKAIQLFSVGLDKPKLNPKQRLFIYEWVCKYINKTDFEDESIDLFQVLQLLKSQTERLKAETRTDKPLTANIRETLKELMQTELKQLPETLKGLEPVQRLNILCKLMPFVLPKVESVNHTQGEPNNNGFDW